MSALSPIRIPSWPRRVRGFLPCILLSIFGTCNRCGSATVPADGWSVAGPSDSAAEQARSPENQVFQFMDEETFVYAPDSKVSAKAYLWIPERCARIRGLLILGQNVPEHTLVGHPAIRAVCEANGLGIVWSTPSYFSTKNKDPAKTIAFLQRFLDTFAKDSGYDEVATVPWLPMGESGHLLMVDALLDGAPERCIAGIYVKNAHYFCKNRETPILVAVGNAQEWGQDKVDIRTRWNDLSYYDAMLKERAAFPRWPMSLLIEGGSGHFDCTEAMVRYFSAYIDAAVKARVPADPGKPLNPVDFERGFFTGLPLPGHTPVVPLAVGGAATPERLLPWYFSAALANASYAAASINWKAQSQMPAYLDESGRPILMTMNGVTNPVPLVTGQDGVSFEVKVGMLPAIPPNFSNAGEALARAPGNPIVEWICGPIAPLGNGRFRISLDRTWPKSPICVAVREWGTPEIRAAVQPGYLSLKPNTVGAPQSIAFDPIPDASETQRSIRLSARSSLGLPVDFFVVAGPAEVKDGALVFTPIPPRVRQPVKVSVTAWQWGRSVEPRVQTAKTVTRTFLLAPSALP